MHRLKIQAPVRAADCEVCVMDDEMTMGDLDAVLRSCAATRHLAGRVRTAEFLTTDGRRGTWINARDFAAMLRDLHAIVDTAPAHAIPPLVRIIAENSRDKVQAIEAFAEHGMDACGQGDA